MNLLYVFVVVNRPLSLAQLLKTFHKLPGVRRMNAVVCSLDACDQCTMKVGELCKRRAISKRLTSR